MKAWFGLQRTPWSKKINLPFYQDAPFISPLFSSFYLSPMPAPLSLFSAARLPSQFPLSTMAWAMEASHSRAGRQLTRAGSGTSPAVAIAGSLHVTQLKRHNSRRSWQGGRAVLFAATGGGGVRAPSGCVKELQREQLSST